MRLLFVEDDHMLGSSLKKGLGFEGYSVEWLRLLSEGAAALATAPFDMAIFDINLPDGCGLDLLPLAQQSPLNANMPILMLTAIDNIEQKVAGLDAGADDYLTKPFQLQELLARLRVLLRRRRLSHDNILQVGDMTLNLATKRLHYKDIDYLPTANELKLLTLLLKRAGNLVSRSAIEEELHGWDGAADSNTAEVTIYNLRKKLGKSSIITLRGVGYMVPV